MVLIGYMRVSKSDGSQVLDLQRDALLAAGVAPERIYADLDSGRKDDRPGLTACLKALQPGNALVVWKLDRLGRDLKHLVNTIDELSRRRGGTPMSRANQFWLIFMGIRNSSSRISPGCMFVSLVIHATFYW
jgi:DNA invertase Pin-like site-specific DNA recombinase